VRIDPERYFSLGFMRREQARLWPRAWLMAAHESELRFGAVELTCGGSAVVLEASAQHGVSARHSASGQAVRSETWAGFVWVNLDDAAADLSSSLGPVKSLIDAYGIGSWWLESHVTTELACNWKASVDAHNEGYHVQALHPEVLPVVDDVGQAVELFGDHARIVVPMARPSPRLREAAALGPELSGMLRAEGLEPKAYGGDAAAARRALQLARRETAAAALADDQLTDNHHYYLFPNLQLSLYADRALVFRHRPLFDQPERTHFDQLVLRRGDAPLKAGERVRRVLPNDPAFGKVTGADLALLPGLQRGLRSRGFRGPLLGSEEKAISGMHAALDRWLHDAHGEPYARAP
jgi:phenylpropionate dioxygenase-like ring-hydroxylating dioxygenase large terminal subunit